MAVKGITQGQGEYIVYHKYGCQTLEKDQFERVYKTLNDLSDYTTLRYQLKEMDSNLEVLFIPRTLYQLIFIRQVMKESLDAGKLCDKTAKEDKCWHICKGPNDHAGIKELSFRMHYILPTLCKRNESTGWTLTQKEIDGLVEKELTFLQEEHQKAEKNQTLTSCNKPDPTTNFRTESTRGSCAPMGIRNEEDKSLIRQVVHLECGERAQDHSLFFRGGRISKDKEKTVTFGPSLFAGAIYDGRAAPFVEMRRMETDAYAIAVPTNKAPPKTHTIVQLCSDDTPVDLLFEEAIVLKLGAPDKTEQELKDLLAKVKAKTK